MDKKTKKPVHYAVWLTEPGGAESLVTAYIEGFSAERDMYLYSLRPSENKLADLPAGHFTSGFDNNRACYTAWFRYCRRYKAHQFHLVNSGPVVLLLALLAGVRNPLYHIHGTIYWKTPLQKLYLKTAWLLSSLFRFTIVANSEYSAAVFKQAVLPNKKLHIVYNGFDVQTFLEKRRQRTELRRMAYIGRFHPDKNVDLVIRLFEDIAAEWPQLELHLAGTGTAKEKIHKLVKDSPYSDRIKLHGWISDVAAFYADVDFFVFPSAHESFGNVVLEALLTGLPVLASDLPAFREIHGGDPAFSLGDPSNFEQAKAAFLRAIAQFPELAEKACALGPCLGARFSMEQHLEGVGALYASS